MGDILYLSTNTNFVYISGFFHATNWDPYYFKLNKVTGAVLYGTYFDSASFSPKIYYSNYP